MISPYIDYKSLEEVIKPHGFSIRITPEPRELHWLGFPIKRKFKDKKALVDYLNMKIYKVIEK